MTDDLVKRLRDPDYKSANGNCFEGLLRDLCDEAADHIKKLEAALRDVLLWGDHCVACDYDDDWEKIEVRARLALERKDD
jgi:hypothetical protein